MTDAIAAKLAATSKWIYRMKYSKNINLQFAAKLEAITPFLPRASPVLRQRFTVQMDRSIK